MRIKRRLGPANLALLALYFAPVWGAEALRALTSPYGGFEERAHATAATAIGRLLDLRLDGLMHAANLLAGLKLVIAAGFLAYAIEFARAFVVGREVNRVAKTLREHGIQVTALHNHALTDTPRLFYMHFWANDDPVKLAQGLKAALELTNSKKAEGTK